MEVEKLTQRLKELISSGERLLDECPSMKYQLKNLDNPDTSFRRIYSKWRLQTLNLIRTFFGEQHYFFKDLKTSKSKWTHGESKDNQHHFIYTPDSIADQLGVLSYILEEVDRGALSDAKQIFEANLFSNLLDQAESLVSKRYFIAAAVYGRIVIENWVNELLRSKGLEKEEREEISDKLVRLRKAGTFDLPTERVIQAHYDIGSYAVHVDDKFENYKEEGKMIEFINNIRTKILVIS